MNDLAKAQRVAQMLKVIEIMQNNPKTTQIKACDQVGISISTFRRYLSENEETILEFNKEIRMVERNELALILSYQGHIMNQILIESLLPGTFVSDKLAVKRYMDKRQAELGDSMRATIKAEDEGFDGPKRIPAISTGGLTIDENADGSITVKPKPFDIIDGEVLSPLNEVKKLPGA
jgi:hypothetical protein